MRALTHRQKQVVSGLASSLNAKQLAYRLNVAEQTIHSHLKNAALAIGVKPNRDRTAQLTRYAYEKRLIVIDLSPFGKGEVVHSYLNSDLPSVLGCECEFCRDNQLR